MTQHATEGSRATPPGESPADMRRNAGMGVTEMTQPGTGDRPLEEHPERDATAGPNARHSRPQEIAPVSGAPDRMNERS